MKVRLKDRTEFIVTNDQAEKIKKAIDDGAIGIDLGDKWFRADQVASIMPGGHTEVDLITDKTRLIEAPDNRGRPSAAKELLREKMKKLRK